MTEFGFIDKITELVRSLPTNGFEGIGDDCAVLEVGGGESLLFTSDMLTEGVHFSLDYFSAFDLGVKSLAVNLSDIAAMGATPTATLLSLSLPKGIDERWAEEFMRGYHSVSERYGVALVGGDTTSSVSLISINVTAIGRAQSAHIKRRSAARAGDVIMVTGSLGDSSSALKSFLEGDLHSPFAESHLRPTPRVEEGVWLGAQSSVHAMMDISDGVASDIRHIMKRSQVGAKINIDTLPSQHDSKSALCGGEDYELLLSVDAASASELVAQFREKFSTSITPIGEIIADNKLSWISQGEELPLDLMGFRHF